MVSALEAFHCTTLYTIALKRSRHDAELKLLIPVLSRFGFSEAVLQSYC